MTDSSTFASLPGHLPVSRSRYVRYFSNKGIDRLYCRFCTYLPWIARDLPWVGKRVRHWQQTQEQFLYGCLNPAIVFDSARGMIAVFTSLGAESRYVPVVKIVYERLDMLPRHRRVNGSRLAAISLYYKTAESYAKGCWSDFSPTVVDCMVEDSESCQRAMARLNPKLWEALETASKEIDYWGREGLFYVNLPDDMVRDAFSSD